MANEIAVSLSLRADKGNFSEQANFANIRIDQAAVGAAAGVVTVSTSAAQTIAFGDVSTAGYVAVRNLSTATSGTAYISVGSLSGTNLTEVVRLRRGNPAVFPIKPDLVMGAQANAAAPVQLQYVILSE
jgi:hypothetical protein